MLLNNAMEGRIKLLYSRNIGRIVSSIPGEKLFPINVLLRSNDKTEETDGPFSPVLNQFVRNMLVIIELR